MTPFIISQILAGLALGCDVASFQFKNRKTTLGFFALSASLLATHFFLLGATTAGFVVAVSAARFVVSIFTTNTRIKYLSLVIIFGLGIWTYDGFEDVFITAAMLLSTFAAFHVNEKRLRQYMMAATVLVITHNLIIFTPVGAFVETVFLSSNLLSYWRFYIKKQTLSEIGLS